MTISQFAYYQCNVSKWNRRFSINIITIDVSTFFICALLCSDHLRRLYCHASKQGNVLSFDMYTIYIGKLKCARPKKVSSIIVTLYWLMIHLWRIDQHLKFVVKTKLNKKKNRMKTFLTYLILTLISPHFYFNLLINYSILFLW